MRANPNQEEIQASVHVTEKLRHTLTRFGIGVQSVQSGEVALKHPICTHQTLIEFKICSSLGFIDYWNIGAGGHSCSRRLLEWDSISRFR